MAVPFVIYGSSLVLAFGSSAAYHGTRRWARNWILATLDHCAIFLVIAGTYTPFGLIALRDRGGASLVAIEWALAFIGILARLFWIRRLHRFSIPLYLAMGWLGVAWSRPLIETVGPMGVSLILIGGAAFTLGILAYRWHRFAFHNPVWHLFVMAGAAFHFWTIAVYVLPDAGQSAGLQ
jgi:hemolysin III